MKDKTYLQVILEMLFKAEENFQTPLKFTDLYDALPKRYQKKVFVIAALKKGIQQNKIQQVIDITEKRLYAGNHMYHLTYKYII